MKEIRSNTFLTGAMYAPFCRTTPPPMEEWESDMKKMAGAGFSVAHGFAEWHDIEYEKGRFDFTKIDHFVESASRAGIVPLINVATQNSVGFYSPRWLMEEHRGRERGYVDVGGDSELQGQFATPCLDDPIYGAYAHRFLKAAAKHFAGDPRVGGYVIWGEPCLWGAGNGKRICYCEYTVAKFRLWLREKYGSIETLNRVWSSEGPADYIDFCQVLPPTNYSRQRGGYASWEDWTSFMEQDLVGHVKEANRIFKENGAMQPTIVEMLTGINNGIDSWRLAEAADIVGISCFDRPGRDTALYMSMADSIAKALNKTTFVVEAHGGSRKYAPAVCAPTPEELNSTLLQRAGYGARGLMFWCWRPRMSDVEGNDFGLARSDGKVKRSTLELGKCASALAENYGKIYANTRRDSPVAVFQSQSANHLLEAEFMEESVLNAIMGAHYLLSDLHISSDFICESEILKGSLKKYKVLILPCSYLLSPEAAAAIGEFVQNGGTVIADYILAEKMPGGFCYSALPGGGLSEVFGLEREDIVLLENASAIEKNVYGAAEGELLDLVEPAGARVLKTLGDLPLLTCNSYGKGKAYYITTRFFCAYSRSLSAAQRQELLPLLLQAGAAPTVGLEAADQADAPQLLTVTLNRADTGEAAAVTVTNSGGAPAEDTVILPEGLTAHLGGEAPETVPHEVPGLARVKIRLKPRESMVLYRG